MNPDQKHLEKRLAEELLKRGFDKKKLDKMSIYEIEEKTRIGHYKCAPYDERSEHVFLSSYLKDKMDWRL